MIQRSQLVEIDLLHKLPEPEFDRIVEMAARVLGSEVSLFSVIDEEEDKQFFKAETGLPPDLAECRQTPLSHSFCKTVVTEGQAINVEDARSDWRFKDHPAIESLGVIAYLGVPVTAGPGAPIGALCAVAPSPRAWSAEDEQNLATLAHAISEIVSHRLTIQREIEVSRQHLESNIRFRDIAESIPGAVFRYILRPDGSDAVEYMSSGCAEIWETPAEEIERDAAKLWDYVIDSDRAGMKASIERSARTLDLWSHRWTIVTESGKRKSLQGYGVPNRQSDGTYIWNSVIIEVTTEVRAVERVLEQEAALAELHKQEVIGQIAAGVAHDFNNLLFVIMSNAEMLATHLSDESLICSAAEIMDASKRGSEMTSSLLAFARRSELRPETIDANATISGIQTLISRTLPENIELKFSFADQLQPTIADRGLLERAILNLAINARDAMPGGGKLTIETCDVDLDADFIAERIEDVEPGPYVMIAVTDSGIGIAKSDIDRVFEPFFSTKGPDGTGLGLSMVFGFAKQSHGLVRIYSERDHGTSIKIFLPASTTSSPAVSKPQPSTLPSLEGVHALVAEDNPAVRRTLLQILKSAQMTFVEAASGDEALALYDEDPSQIDFVLTDVVMPGRLQGPDLVYQIRRRNEKIPVIYLSGYPHEANVHGNNIRAQDMTLMKPVSRSTLICAIGKVMNR